MRPSNAKIVIKTHVENNQPILLVGQPGIGKTDMITQCADELDYDVVTILLSQSDPTDAKGYPAIVNGKALHVPFGDLVKLTNASKPLMVFLDDLGQAMPAVQAAFMNLLNSRQVGGAFISDNVRFVAATNRREDKANVAGIIEPAKSRFHTILPITPDVEDFIQWGERHDLDANLLAYCRYTEPDKIFNFKPTMDMTNTASPRTIYHLSEHIKQDYPKNLQYEIYAGAVGDQFASGFLSFLEIIKDLPSFQQVFIDPHTAQIPEQTASLYALIAQLISRANQENINQIITYADRLEAHNRKEFAVALIIDSLNRNESLHENKAVIRWKVEHQEVFF